MQSKAPASPRPLWRCPACRRRFANRNQSHACGRHDLAHHFVGKSVLIRRLYQRFVRVVRRCGPVIILPEKTRIAFQVRMSFAAVVPKKQSLDGHLVLARRVRHPHIRKIETFSPRNHVHYFRACNEAELDAEFLALLSEA